MNYKKYLVFSLVSVVVLSSALPVLAMESTGRITQTRAALNTSTRPTLTASGEQAAQIQTRLQETFCASFNKFSQTISQRLTDRTAKVNERRNETQVKLQEKRTDRTDRITKIKDTAKEKRLKNYDKLSGFATNDELKAALEKFKTTVENAINMRRAAVEEANKAFRTAVDAAMAERKALIESITTEYRAMVDTARSEAAEACKAEDFDAAAIRTELQSKLQAAKEFYQSKKAELEKLQVDLEPARAAHKAAIEQTIKEFKAAMDAARAELKQAFLTFGEKKQPESQATSTEDNG